MSYHDIGLHDEARRHEASALDIPHDHGWQAYRTFGKRLLDLALSLALLPVLAPIMGLIWALVRQDGGAALFCQPRVGRNGQVFFCYKFRTMVVDAERVLDTMLATDPVLATEWRRHQKLHNDPRITRFGDLLRKTSLDELPQIFNVLKGEMSLVGPRPFTPSQNALYRTAGGRAYYSLRPGVTGLWQVMSRHDTTFAARVRFDERYSAKCSLLGDLGLILRTIKVVLRRTGR